LIVAEVESIGGFAAAALPPAAGRHPLPGAGLHDPCRSLDGGYGVYLVRPAIRVRVADAGRDEPAHPLPRPDHPPAQRQRGGGGNSDDASNPTDNERIQQVFELNMGVFK
jgi:hypothetical protein